MKSRWRLIFALLILACAALFASLNSQRVDVSVGVHVFKDIPLFLTLLLAFIAGALCVLPYALVSRRGKSKAARGDAQQHPGTAGPSA